MGIINRDKDTAKMYMNYLLRCWNAL